MTHPLYIYRLKQSGFSLIELMAVMVITGILSATAFVKFSPSDIDLQTAKSDLLAALVYARETAMARSDGLSNISVVLSSSSIDVRINNASVDSVSQQYPLSLKSSVSITGGTGTLSFNRLGETSEHSITLTQGASSDVVTISGVGYAY